MIDNITPMSAYTKQKKFERESGTALQAYTVYLELGSDRSAVKVIEHYKQNAARYKGYVPNIGTIKHWSAVHNWKARILAVEKEQLTEKQTVKKKQREQMDELHAELAKQQAAAMALYIDQLRKEKRLTGAEAVSYFGKLIELERKARGSATEKIEVTSTAENELGISIDPKMLSDTELAQLKALAQGLRDRELS